MCRKLPDADLDELEQVVRRAGYRQVRRAQNELRYRIGKLRKHRKSVQPSAGDDVSTLIRIVAKFLEDSK